MYTSGFTCLSCGADHPEELAAFVCPACGGNLEVDYDYEALRGLIAEHKLLSTERADIFRYHALLPIRSLEHATPLRIGATPLYHARRLGDSLGLRNLYLKDDGLNPSGSFKDRASAVALAHAREAGAEVVCGASTGNAGSSMACLAASVGMPCVIFVPEAAPPAKLTQLQIFGAHVLAVRGSYDDAFDLCMKVCEEQGWYNRNTGFNPFTREGKKTASFEICEEMSWLAPDRVIVCAGDGNIISGLWKGMKDLHALDLIEKRPRMDCAQSAQSAAITRAARALRGQELDPATIDWSAVTVEPVQATTLADSISVDLPRDGIAGVRAILESGGEAVTVDDSEILPALPELARLSGVFVEPSAATTFACLKKLVAEQKVDPDERIVCMLTGNGLKDVAHAQEAAGSPTPIEPTVEAARAAVEGLL